MRRRTWKATAGTLLALGMLGLLLFTVRASGGGGETWSTDTFSDFVDHSTMDGVDVWSAAGSARLDRRWFLDTRINDASNESKFSPRISFALTNTGTMTETIFLAVWADERTQDHYADVYFARSFNGGRTWTPDILASGAHQNGLGKNTPDIAVRATDEKLWVVWHETSAIDGGDPGDIKYATSADKGNSWSAASVLHNGEARLPRILSHGASGTLYTIWEDERDDDGDVYISRYTSSWGAPVKVNDDATTVEQSKPKVAVDVDGNVYAVWEDRREDEDGQVYFSRWISGTVWDESNWMPNVRLSNPTMCSASAPDITVGSLGILYATWVEKIRTGPSCTTFDYQIVVARSNDQGENWNHAIVKRLYDASGGGAVSSYEYPAISVDQSGKVYMTWIHVPDQTAYAESNVLFALSPDRGQHWTTSRILNAGQAVCGDAPLSLVSSFEGEVVAAWEDYREPSGRQIYATGYPADNYLSNGSYVRTLDVGGMASWDAITWTATISPNTGLQLATRVLTETSAGWTNWVMHTSSGEALPHPDGRQIQYRAVFTSTHGFPNQTAVLDEVIISYQPRSYVYLPLLIRSN